MKITALLLSLLLLSPLAARAEQFVVAISGSFAFVVPDGTPFFGGKIKTLKITKPLILSQFGNKVEEELVYDTVTDSVLVVKKATGALTGVQFKFTSGLTITSTNGLSARRQAFVEYQGLVGARGSAVGPISITKNADSSLKTYKWTGAFQLNVPADNYNGQDLPAGILTGTFVVGKKFVPTGS